MATVWTTRFPRLFAHPYRTFTSYSSNSSSNSTTTTSTSMEQHGNKHKRKTAWANKAKAKKEFVHRNAERFATQGSWRRDSQSLAPSAGSFRTKEMQELFGVTVDMDSLLSETPKPPTDDDDQEDTPRNKRKVAMLIAFCGSKYSGFQINPLCNSVQAHLELALLRANLILPANFGYPHKYGWSSSARTDKGVHALAQVVSLKLEFGEDTEDQARERINAVLPKDIVVLDIQRTTRAFCAKTQRSKVRYQYMIPSFLLYPKEELSTIFKGMEYKPSDEANRKNPLTMEQLQKVKPTLNAYRATPHNLQQLKSALSQFKGTKPYHNFTKNMRVGDKAAKRYIIDFVADPPILMDDGTEWIPTRVTGQAFLFNQIRKMVSMAVDVARGAATAEHLDHALDMVSIKTGLAPAQGLFLEMSDFSAYNEFKKNDDMPDLDWMQQPDSQVMQRWKAFRDDNILSLIGKEEAEESNFITYLYNMEFIFGSEKAYMVRDSHDTLNDNDEEGDHSNEEEGDTPATKEDQ